MSESNNVKTDGFWPLVLAAAFVIFIVSAAILATSYSANKDGFKAYFNFNPSRLSSEEREFVRPAVTKKLNELKSEISRVDLERRKLVNSSGGQTLEDIEENLANLREYGRTVKLARKNFARACDSARYFNIIEDCSLDNPPGNTAPK